jgi:DNA-binding response OmpR family regulator
MGRVLVVEDEFLIALELSGIVERAGYSVVGPAESVDATRKVLAKQKVDLALLDINLGGELVFPIAEYLEAIGLPYIFVTGNSPSSLPAEYRHRPLVQKPYNSELLLALIEEHLAPAEVTRVGSPYALAEEGGTKGSPPAC